MTTQTTPQKSSITQRLRTDLGRSVGVTTATQLVWLTGLRAQGLSSTGYIKLRQFLMFGSFYGRYIIDVPVRRIKPTCKLFSFQLIAVIIIQCSI